MRKIHIIGVAFAAVFALSMVGASSASALSLWDQCTKTAPVLEFTESNCVTKGSPATFGWEEIKTLLVVDSLLTTVTFTSGPVTIKCEGSVDGSVGPGAEGEVTEVLSNLGELVTSAKPVTCTTNGGVCGASATAFPVNLPWNTLLEATEGMLFPGSKGGNAGWHVKCTSGLENECTKELSFFVVTNLLAELEVDLASKATEKVTCTNALAKEGTVEGTVSILLVNGNGLQAM